MNQHEHVWGVYSEVKPEHIGTDVQDTCISLYPDSLQLPFLLELQELALMIA